VRQENVRGSEGEGRDGERGVRARVGEGVREEGAWEVGMGEAAWATGTARKIQCTAPCTGEAHRVKQGPPAVRKAPRGTPGGAGSMGSYSKADAQEGQGQGQGQGSEGMPMPGVDAPHEVRAYHKSTGQPLWLTVLWLVVGVAVLGVAVVGVRKYWETRKRQQGEVYIHLQEMGYQPPVL